MEAKPIPAHLVFAKWFIKIRWIAVSLLFICAVFINKLLYIPIQLIPICIFTFLLLGVNFIHFFILKKIIEKEEKRALVLIKRFLHFQIIIDLIVLTFLLHYSGGIENPLIILYYFHMIVASAIFSSVESYSHNAFIIIILGLMAIFECYGIIPHYHLNGFVDHQLYKNEFYIYGAGSVFAISSVLLVSLTHLIVSKSIKVEESYVKTNQQLEKKETLKNEYVFRVTHDIKGHLAAIISCLEVLRNKQTGTLNQMQDEFVNRAYRRTDLLVNFVRDLLNLTKKRLVQDIEFEEFSLIKLIDQVKASVQPLANDKSIELNVCIVDTIDFIVGNPFTIEEMFCNLLFNSVKYTPQNGKIELFIRENKDQIITEITDSGIGIPPDEISKIFDEFYRANNVPKDIRTGSGLGLSIVKQIVDNHKGKISVQSEPGIWTKFTISLPKNPGTIGAKYAEKISIFPGKINNE